MENRGPECSIIILLVYFLNPADLEFGKKKKKKKTRDINLDELEEALPDKDEDEAASADVQEDLDLESFGKKKKKKKRGGEADGNLGPEDGRDPEDDKENGTQVGAGWHPAAHDDGDEAQGLFLVSLF